MKSKLKKWFNDIKCGFREDNRNCMRYKAYGVFVSLLGVLMSCIIAFSAFLCGRHSSEKKSNVVTASAENISNPTFNDTYNLRIDSLENMIIRDDNNSYFYSVDYFEFDLSSTAFIIDSHFVEYTFSYNLSTFFDQVPLYVSDMPISSGYSSYIFGYFACGISSLPSISIDILYSDYVLENYEIRYAPATGKTFYNFIFNFAKKDDLSITESFGFYMNFYPSVSSNITFYNGEYFNSLTYSSPLTADYWYYYYLQNSTLGENIYQDGYDSGYDSGYDYGYRIGRSEGYQAGINTAEHGTFANAVSTVLGAPVTVVSQFLDFDILGFNMLAFVAGLITLMIIIKLLRIFI